MNGKEPDQTKDRDQEICWESYILGELNERQRQYAEELLLNDAGALEAYMAALARLEHGLPGLQQEEALIEAVLQQLPAQHEAQPSSGAERSLSRKRRISEHPLFNYFIAASITLFLLSFGVFDRLSSGADHVLPPSSEPPVSERIMHKTAGWIDHLKP